MNSYQKSFCLVDEVLGANAVNRISCVINFKKEISIAVLQKAVELTCQSVYLRKKYDMNGISYTDDNNAGELSQLIRFSSREEIADYIEQRKREPIDWHDAYLLGIEILVCGNEATLFCWFHHMMYDGLSLNLVLDKIIDTYCRLRGGNGAVPPYFDAENLSETETDSYSNSVQYETDRDFWRKKIGQLKDIKSTFKTDITETKSSRCGAILDGDLSNRIEEYCKKVSLTMPTFFLAVTALLVKPFFESDNLCVGVTLHNRKRNQMNSLGMVLNTVPLIIEPKSQERFPQFARRINAYLNEAYRHRAFPQKDIGFSPQVLYSFQVNSFASDTDLFQCEWLFSEETTIPLAISVDDIHRSGSYKIALDYRLSDINSTYAQLLLQKFIELCQIVIREDCVVHPDSVITPSEKNILASLNQTKNAYPQHQTVVEMFERTVQTHADKIAVRLQNQEVTYAELNRQACRVADYLLSLNVRPNDIVAIVLDKSLEMVYAIWGVIKAGAAYLPLDPQWPRERVETICATARVKYMIADAAMTAPDGVTLINFSQTGNSQKQKQKPYPVNSVDDILYVIFTSGTTGVPKGVCVSHKNIMNLAHDTMYRITDKDRFLQIINYTFDVSVMGYIVALMQGATLVIAEESVVLDPQLTAQMVEAENITMLNTTTALLNQWLPYLESFSQIKCMMTGGEKLTPATVNQAMQYLSGKLLNAYGPTETTVFSTVHIIDQYYQADVPIGRPIGNTTAAVLDKQGKPVSINQVGELCIGGDGVTLGYLNNETETRKFFVKNPSGDGIIYKTGDLCLINEQGLIECRGRKDDQVKIRGYRVEISEIENALCSAGSIKNATVVAENGRIIAYICRSHDIETAELITFLQGKLPSYMIPSIFKVVSEIPLTSNGKVDKQAIEKYVIQNTRIDVSDDSLSADEKTIKAVFVSALGFKEFGIYDNFFSLGGSSLDAMKVVSEINGRFDASLKVSDFYKNSTVEALAGFLNGSRRKSNLPARPVVSAAAGDKAPAIQERAPVTPAQAMMYSIWNMDKQSTSYNTPVLIKLKRNIDTIKLERCLTKLVEAHEVLRSRIIFAGEDIVQSIEAPYKVKLITQRQASKDFNQFIKPFDLNNGYPFRASLLSYGNNRYLLLDFHHCFIDGTSIMLLLQDLDAFYHDESYAPHRFLYADYANYLQKQDTKESAAFWQAAVQDALPANIDCRLNRNKPPAGTGEFEFVLDGSLTERLHDCAKRNGISIHNYLLACFTVLLAKYDNEGKAAIGTALSGRTDRLYDDSIGMYVNTIPVVFEINQNKTVKEHIQNIVEFLAKAYDHQSFGFNNIVQAANIQRSSSRNPIFDIMFIIQNTELSSCLGDVVSDDSLQIQEKFDLTVEAKILDEIMTMRITYKRELYDELTIHLLTERFKKVLGQIVGHDTALMKDISMVTELDVKLLAQFNRNDCVYPTAKTVSQCMLEAAQEHSRRRAVIKGKDFITYHKLLSNAKKIAGTIQKKGYGRNDIIGLYCVRSIEMIEAIWGIILAGAAYMPIEMDAPKPRVDYMLQEGDVKLILTYGTDTSFIPDKYTKMDIADIKNDKQKSSYMEPANSPNDLLYIMFTSGSTGNPKGVQVEHRNVVEFVFGMGEIESKRFLSVSNYAFDGSVYDIFTPLLTGGSVTVLDREEAMDPSCIAQTIRDKKIHSMFLPAALFNMFTDEDLMKTTSIRRLYIGGEKLSPTHVKRGLAYLPGKLYNGYGPTEATVFSATHKIEPSDGENDIPIGKPFNTTKIQILDDNNQLSPVGVTGHIYIAGDGVSRGYLHPTDEAGAKFKIDVDTGVRTYASGDVGRWNTRGLVEYFGRKDNQVKFRGFRIELDEIRQKILEFSNVEDAAVIVLEKNQNKEIYAYYVAKKNNGVSQGVTVQDLDMFLKQVLPEYMVPRFYGEVDRIPLNINGKVDKKKLELVPVATPADQTFEQPRTDIEKRIAEIWQQLFNVRISRNDDFFGLGGHSIQAIRFISEMKKDGIDINVKDVLDNSTLISLARHIDRLQSSQMQSALNDNSAVFHIEPHAAFKRLSQHSAEKAIFVFPTYMLNIAYALTFTKMAESIKSHSLYLGNFTNSNNYIEEYSKEFLKHAKKYKEIWMLGYSFGGCLAYEVAQLATRKGINIEGIIMLDSFFKATADTGLDTHLDEFFIPGGLRNILEERFDFYQELDISLKESIESCFLNFLEHTSSLINKKELLNTTIHYMRAEHQDLDVRDTRDEWKQACSQGYQEYTASGTHNVMLDLSHFSKNADIISKILS